jgi:FkbM family methyltransferase
VEAHRDYYDLLRRNRPGSVCVHAAVGDRNADSVPFYANRRGSLSTLDAGMEAEFRQRFGPYFSGFEIQQVPLATLNTILSEANAPTPIDLISIDVEGAEMGVLRGLDLATYRPRVLIIEAAFDGEADEMDAYMETAGYFLVRDLCSNRFYCHDHNDAAVLAEASPDVVLRHHAHPLDSGREAIGQSR